MCREWWDSKYLFGCRLQCPKKVNHLPHFQQSATLSFQSPSTMDSFVASHPFPSYKEMQAAIERHPDVAMSMAMWAEFGKAHYAALKDAYESVMDPAVIRKAGQIIHDLGGYRAMQMNFYVFMHFSPFRFSDDPDIQYAYKQLEYKWDGVGDWVA
jgi:hypothetical protein